MFHLRAKAYFEWGLLHKAKNRLNLARECISEAIMIFKKCEAKVYMAQANNALESLRER